MAQYHLRQLKLEISSYSTQSIHCNLKIYCKSSKAWT